MQTTQPSCHCGICNICKLMSLQDFGKTMNAMAMEHTTMQMEIPMKENGNPMPGMEKECTNVQQLDSKYTTY